MSICYYEWIRLDEWLMKNKNSVEQNIAFIFSVNVNTALNLIPMKITRVLLTVALEIRNSETLIYDHIAIVLALCA